MFVLSEMLAQCNLLLEKQQIKFAVKKVYEKDMDESQDKMWETHAYFQCKICGYRSTCNTQFLVDNLCDTCGNSTGGMIEDVKVKDTEKMWCAGVMCGQEVKDQIIQQYRLVMLEV